MADNVESRHWKDEQQQEDNCIDDEPLVCLLAMVASDARRLWTATSPKILNRPMTGADCSQRRRDGLLVLNPLHQIIRQDCLQLLGT